MGDNDLDEDVPQPPQRSHSSRNTVAPSVSSGIPPGLGYLANLDMVVIQQQMEIGEIFSGCECKNEYLIKDNFGRDIFQAKERSCCLFRQLCGKFRSFDMEIKNPQGMEVIHLQRPLRCTCCCCCLQKIDVFAPRGQLIGTVKQSCTIFKPNFNVKNASGDTVLVIKGPCCQTSCCCNDVEFKVFAPDGENQVGRISKKWGGLFAEGFTDADVFGINFPMDLDTRMKATLIGACLLIDFIYFEDSGKNSDDSWPHYWKET